MNDKEEEWEAPTVKEIMEFIKEKRIGENLREILEKICVNITDSNSSILLSFHSEEEYRAFCEEIQQSLTNQLRKHRHLSDGTVVEEI
jgi:F0F1-type ATP synthase delta subunit